MINTKINNNQHKKSNYQQMDSIKTKKTNKYILVNYDTIIDITNKILYFMDK